MSKLTVTNPQTNEVLQELNLSTAEEIFEMVDRAREAQKEWAQRSLFERSQILYHFLDLYKENIERLASMSSLEMGKPYRQSMHEVAKASENIRGTIEYASHLYGQVLPDNDSEVAGDLVFTKREPLGIIAGIVPFNYPVEAAILKSIPAPFIVCERTASTNAIVKNPKVDAISLTGSTAAGIQFMKDSAEFLKPLFLELGGNDPFIICHDADLDAAVEEMIEGRLYNTGQTCCAPKRFIVDRKICDALTEKLIARLKVTVRGDVLDPNTQISTLVTEKAAIEVELQVQNAIGEGAVLAYGGKREGAYFDPTVLINVKRAMSVASDDEIFGPVFPIIPFDTEKEAIEIANQSKYGLNAGVLSKDMMRAFSIAAQIEAGSVVVNGHGAFRHIDQAHGGVKMSGLGREGISTSLEEFSRVKNYVLKGAFRRP